jgi:molybdopterin synthase catalytic subunit
MIIDIRVQNTPFDPEAECIHFRRHCPDSGAFVNFLGVARHHNAERQVTALMLEHYPGMTERVLRTIVEKAQQKWPVQGIRLIHRVGTLLPQDPIVLIIVGAYHRQAAFQSCEFLIDALKAQAPIWKQEITTDGVYWVQNTQHAR